MAESHPSSTTSHVGNSKHTHTTLSTRGTFIQGEKCPYHHPVKEDIRTPRKHHHAKMWPGSKTREGFHGLQRGLWKSLLVPQIGPKVRKACGARHGFGIWKIPLAPTPDLNPPSSEGPPPGSPDWRGGALLLSPQALQATPSAQALLQQGWERATPRDTKKKIYTYTLKREGEIEGEESIVYLFKKNSLIKYLVKIF